VCSKIVAAAATLASSLAETITQRLQRTIGSLA